jgi:purine-cytosine permease-like protein
LRQMVLSRFWFGWWGVKLSMGGLTSTFIQWTLLTFLFVLFSD